MDNASLQQLLEELTAIPNETEWVEFKQNKSITDDQIGEYISALSNSATVHNQQYGYLVWGVKDDTHDIVGTHFCMSRTKHGNKDGANQELELFLRRSLTPKINFEKFEFQYNDVEIVLLRIPAARSEPTRFKSKAYIRIGSNKTQLDNYPDLMRIIYNSQDDWSAIIVEKATLDDLDPQAILMARRKYKELNTDKTFHDKIDGWDNSQFLDKARITINGKITHTALILLGKSEATHYLSPALAEITWKLDNEEQAYEHFTTPFVLTTTDVLNRIRNFKYKLFPDNELLATTVDKYDTRNILEALHNCIAHQDYRYNSRIVLTEKTDRLIFSNSGSFYDGKPEDYVLGTKTPVKYRNQWLTNAMVNLGMIDKMGYGIHTIYKLQQQRFFPMPDYDISQQGIVNLTLYGHVIDENYSKILLQNSNLSLQDAITLDRVQKKLQITDIAAKHLRKQKLIEGRKPNYFIALTVSQLMAQKAEYSKNKAFDKNQYFEWILEAIKQHGCVGRNDIDKLIWNMLPQLLDDKQRKIKINNIIAELRDKDKIVNKGTTRNPQWYLK